jgi:MFS superfamily sulfate permease-like transporter
VGQTLAAKRRQRIEPDQELVALGASNLSAAFTGGFPVTGGFARSVVNFDAGAQTPAAGVYTALGIMLAALFLTPALYYLPQATLAATIIVAVLSLVDLGMLKRTWVYSKTDFIALLVTLLMTLARGVEVGLVVGVAVSLALFDDRVEVWSAGTFPRGITPAMLSQNHLSVQRNPILAEVFFRGGFIERWGRGTNRGIDECVAHLFETLDKACVR